MLKKPLFLIVGKVWLRLPSLLPGVFLLTALIQHLYGWFTLPTHYTEKKLLRFLGRGGVHDYSITQEQSSHYKAHCHHWPANQRHFFAGLQCIILCQRIGLIGTKPDTFVATKKIPRLGGPKMWDHVNRPPVGLSLLFQYHSCQGPCTRWHSLSRGRRCFNSGPVKKREEEEENTRRRGSGRFQLWQIQKGEGGPEMLFEL